MAKPDLSLVLPIYNESKTLSHALDQAIARLEEMGLDFEVLCVDDGSTDASADIAAARSHRDQRVRSLRSERNLGKGAAVQRGVQAARGRWVATLDADLSTDLAILPVALRELEGGASIAIGDRRRSGSCIRERQPFFRELSGRVFSALAKLLVPASVTDFTCGFKAYRRDAAHQIFTDLETTRWAFDVEVIAIALSRGMRIAVLPVTWSHRRDTRVRLPFDALRAFFDLVRIGWLYRFGVYR